MSEYRLSKVKKNELKQVDNKKEIIKGSNNTKLIPTSKNYLVQIGNASKEICAKVTNELVKVTNKALTIVGNKLASIDWNKLLVEFLKSLFISETKDSRVVYRTETRTYRVRTKQVKVSKPQDVKHINSSRIEEIEARKQQQIEAKKQKSIKAKRNPKQIQKKQSNTFKIAKDKPLMIERNKDNEN